VAERRWHVDRWPPLSKAETVTKAVSFYVPPPPVRDLSPAAGTALTGIYALGYAAIPALERA